METYDSIGKNDSTTRHDDLRIVDQLANLCAAQSDLGFNRSRRGCRNEL